MSSLYKCNFALAISRPIIKKNVDSFITQAVDRSSTHLFSICNHF